MAPGNETLDAFDDEFERFFVNTYDDVLRSLVDTLGDREAAVDAAQDGFIRAHTNWSQVRDYESPAAWVRRTAINASRDRLRSARAELLLRQPRRVLPRRGRHLRRGGAGSKNSGRRYREREKGLQGLPAHGPEMAIRG